MKKILYSSLLLAALLGSYSIMDAKQKTQRKQPEAVEFTPTHQKLMEESQKVCFNLDQIPYLTKIQAKQAQVKAQAMNKIFDKVKETKVNA